jgi:divinyl chlorophyllide a 8-vinyl-reductase
LLQSGFHNLNIPKRVLLLGATGTIGLATAIALVNRGHEVICLVRNQSGNELPHHSFRQLSKLDGVQIRFGDVTDLKSITENGFCGENFDAVVSCLASRTGAAKDAWAIDYHAHANILATAKATGVKQFILLSALCVQKPKLAFQFAKLAFEKELMESGITYSIIRPTAYFKSLSGQVERVKRGKPFLLFGDGTMTACKPISDHDLAAYLVDCITSEHCHNRILPIGGPGTSITPKQQAEMLFELLGQPLRVQSVPIRLLDVLVAGFEMLGRGIPFFRQKAELARIGRYYATESMLVLNPETKLYDPQMTPSTGRESLREHYRRMINGEASIDLREHSVF